MTYDEIEVGLLIYVPFIVSLKYINGLQEAYPEDFANRDDDKFNYRYRGRIFIFFLNKLY